MTGSQGARADRRRVRGAHRGLKKILIEGMTNGGEPARPWKDFSGAMVRQAVNEAMNQLPPEQEQVVKLAYFGGLSNREIAQDLGLSIGGVQRRLRLALARVSEHLEHGRTAGRRAFMALAGWLAARPLMHAFKLATVTVAVSVIAVQPAPPATATPHAPATAHSPVLSDMPQRDPGQAHNAPAPPTAVSVPDPVQVVTGLQVKLPALPPLPTPAVPKLP